MLERGCRTLGVVVWWVVLSSPLAAADLITREEALAAAYPSAEIEAERVFLTSEQVRKAAALSGSEVPSALVARYVARRDGAVVGRHGRRQGAVMLRLQSGFGDLRFQHSDVQLALPNRILGMDSP